jgi:glycosyltransferase involved in cell wall biosynthesis
MRILFITDNFPPEVNAPASRTFEHCREWVKCGHKVTVVTCFPNFPIGKVYDGYVNQLAQLETVSGIEVVRVLSFITTNSGFLKRILDYASFMITAVLVSLKLGQYDKVIGTSPQFFTVLAAYTIGRIKNTPFIFELRDIWPESIRAVGAMANPIVLNVFEKMELFLYKRSQLTISVTESFKKNLISRGISGNKIKVIRNGVDLERFFPREKNKKLATQYGLNESFNVGYIGTHGLAHALETILEAALIIQKHRNLGSTEIKFILIGSGACKEKLIKYAEELQLHNVIFIDSVTKSYVAEHWSILDLCIVHLKRTELFKSVIPSKIFESMGMGIPLIHGVKGESAEIVKHENLGWTFEPENANSLANTILEALNSPTLLVSTQENCLRAARQFDRKKLAKEMLDIIIQLK